MAGVAQGNGGKSSAGNGLGPRTRIVGLAKTNMTQAELDAALVYLATGDGTNNDTDGPHTIAGVSVLTESGVFTSGTTDAVQVAIQGTGAFTAGSDFGVGSTGVTSSLIADFDQTPA
tara:strand:- start:7915 stop:8265 length:351 start_codon:yes stop_codon:yes gene_type:complete